MHSEPSASNRKPRSERVWQLALPSPRHTDRLGRAIGSALQGGESLALYGPLGSGKTALVRGIAAGLGATSSAVTSPTFVLLHEYRGRLPLAHVDLYRLSSPKEVESIGLDDYLSGSTVVVIEWADKAPGILPPDRLEMQLRHRTVQSRSIRLMATGPLSAALLARTRTKRSSRRPRSGRPPSATAKGLSSR
ncbi:MAG TPA: tRNA (adenosine(37)-N6)-threonylcarbamoyltransferase complex ATPase subunit type 1 TsaE [Nitrospira sp.]|nr:tRNA (adenosine(37)-N6)-threonylcarbamoyltransferase complex ATPase subunit type 1 TsaE [Nitrospira sp.]